MQSAASPVPWRDSQQVLQKQPSRTGSVVLSIRVLTLASLLLPPKLHFSERQKYMGKTRIPPRTVTHAWASLPSFPGIDVTAPSALLQIAVDCNKNSSRRVLAILTACFLIGDPCRVCCKPPSLLGLFVELLLHLPCTLSGGRRGGRGEGGGDRRGEEEGGKSLT